MGYFAWGSGGGGGGEGSSGDEGRGSSVTARVVPSGRSTTLSSEEPNRKSRQYSVPSQIDVVLKALENKIPH